MARKKKLIKLITLDTETYNGLVGGLKRIAIYDGKEVTYGYKFLDIEPKLIEYEKQGFQVHVYIHNMEFDLRKIPQVFYADRIVWEKCFVINGKLATVACKHYTFHDSFKLLPMSLSKLSKDFGVEHGKLDLLEEVLKTYPGQYEIYDEENNLDKNSTLVNFLDKCPVDDELFLKYLGYDVISLYEILQILMAVSGVDLNTFVKKISTASLSRHVFKNGYKGKEFRTNGYSMTDYDLLCSYKWNDNLKVEEFIRCSYCGGRTEVFKPVLDGQAYHMDINSMYPFVMFEKEFPIGTPEYIDNGEVAQAYFESWLENHDGLGFICATVEIPRQHIPPLPVKMGKLTFPTGVVYGTWTYTELEYAIKNCEVKILEYREVCHFSRTFPVFKNFIDELYKIKQQATHDGNKSLRTFAKLFMNVGYGYTGMNRDKTKLDSIENMSKYEKINSINEELGFIEVPADVQSEYIQVQVASYVTSYARLVLLDALRKADKVGEVYYCDTDSIVTDKPFPDEMIDSEKLGYWDVESKPSSGLFLRPKVYVENDVSGDITKKFKGVSKETQEKLSYDDYQTLYEELQDLKKSEIVVERNKLTMRSIMYMEKQGLSMDYYETRDKKMNLVTIEKRDINYSENWTRPHHFATVEEFENFSYNIKQNVDINILRK